MADVQAGSDLLLSAISRNARGVLISLRRIIRASHDVAFHRLLRFQSLYNDCSHLSTNQARLLPAIEQNHDLFAGTRMALCQKRDTTVKNGIQLTAHVGSSCSLPPTLALALLLRGDETHTAVDKHRLEQPSVLSASRPASQDEAFWLAVDTRVVSQRVEHALVILIRSALALSAPTDLPVQHRAHLQTTSSLRRFARTPLVVELALRMPAQRRPYVPQGRS